jgi:hypothetical protein
LDVDQTTAISIWPMVLGSVFPYCNQWIEFLEKNHNKPINKDTWGQLLTFANAANEDPSLDNYDPSGM